jgi:hypothetical protein
VSANLIDGISVKYTKTSSLEEFFAKDELDILEKFQREQQQVIADSPCSNNLYFGFFFDGTKNNYKKANINLAHSNVARLYDAYPGISVEPSLSRDTKWVEYPHCFKVYVPGVASPFPQINDDGESTRSAAMGYRCQDRIVWGLMQAINNVHTYFHKSPLLSTDKILELIRSIDLTPAVLTDMMHRTFAERSDDVSAKKTARELIEEQLERLHSAVKLHWTDKDKGYPQKKDPGIVKTIHVSVFGFSRGATEARAFVNFLVAMCICDKRLSKQNGVLTLGGFELKIDFVGIFDTVASIGIGNTFGNSFLLQGFDGHAAWADAETVLRIPTDVRCVHLIAAHEIRRSFPLDSISVKGSFSSSFEEIVVPGMHSDIGGGYEPTEQGKGTAADGHDMLSRIPLIYMYKQARLANVPFRLESADEEAKKKFKISPQTIDDMNAYLALCKCKQGSVTEIMREQRMLYIQWRRQRRAGEALPLEKTASFGRATQFDQNDLHSANLEFDTEVKTFETWLQKKGSGFVPKSQKPGFNDSHPNEWEEIATWWKAPYQLPVAIAKIFDEYVHDSRAWFKMIPGNPDSEEAAHVQLREWCEILAEEKEERTQLAAGSRGDRAVTAPPKSRLTAEQRAAALSYMQTKKIPAMITTGREPFDGPGMFLYQDAKAGYLRFRKVYSGGDSLLISNADRPAQMKAA